MLGLTILRAVPWNPCIINIQTRKNHLMKLIYGLFSESKLKHEPNVAKIIVMPENCYYCFLFLGYRF